MFGYRTNAKPNVTHDAIHCLRVITESFHSEYFLFPALAPVFNEVGFLIQLPLVPHLPQHPLNGHEFLFFELVSVSVVGGDAERTQVNPPATSSSTAICIKPGKKHKRQSISITKTKENFFRNTQQYKTR